MWDQATEDAQSALSTSTMEETTEDALSLTSSIFGSNQNPAQAWFRLKRNIKFGLSALVSPDTSGTTSSFSFIQQKH